MFTSLWTLIPFFLAFVSSLQADSMGKIKKNSVLELIAQDFVIEERQIHLDEYPDAFNPSILKIDKGFLLAFRYCPDRSDDRLSFLGIVELDENFVPISIPQILDTRLGNDQIPSHSEDPRLILIQDEMYILYNDNCNTIFPTIKHRRDMFLARLVKEDHVYQLKNPIRLYSIQHIGRQTWKRTGFPLFGIINSF